MKKCSINSIETFGLADGPGIRTVIFFNGCNLRCKYCHNPEMWNISDGNYNKDEIIKKILRCKSYFRNNGGVTFSGGEPLLHSEFIIEMIKELKENSIHVALDTAGYSTNYKVLDYIDLVILDIKHTDKLGFKNLTGGNIDIVDKFILELNKRNIKVWIRQVIIPDITDSIEYIISLNDYIKKINNVEKIEFLPFHYLGKEKYEVLNIPYPFKDKEEMDKDKCDYLYKLFINMQKKDV